MAIILHVSFRVPIYADLQLDNNRAILITAERCEENNRAIFYEVREGDHVVVPTTYLNGLDGNNALKFSMVYAEDRTLVGVIETSITPHDLVVMHDFKSGESWPRGKDNVVAYGDTEMKRGSEMFRRLSQENSQLPKFFSE